LVVTPRKNFPHLVFLVLPDSNLVLDKHQTMRPTKPQAWREVKAKIILRFGSIGAAARALQCSDEAIRLTVQGKCPNVKRRLEAALR
jgi:hypothetical protein